MKRIRWKAIWKEFEEWYDVQNPHKLLWEQQQRKIQSLVNAELKRKEKKCER